MNNLKKGSISVAQIIGWGVTIMVASVGFSYSQISKVADSQAKIVEAQSVELQRVSVLETESKQYKEDIAAINKKLDILIGQKNGKPN